MCIATINSTIIYNLVTIDCISVYAIVKCKTFVSRNSGAPGYFDNISGGARSIVSIPSFRVAQYKQINFSYIDNSKLS